MRRPLAAALALSLASVPLVTACSGAGAAGDEDEGGTVVPDGKEDDFLSATASEYIFSGRARVTVEAGQGMARAKELISLKHVAIAWFLNQYLVDKEEEDKNHDYGGFGAMVKTGAYEDLDIVKIDATTYEFTFTQVVGGARDLMSRLPLHGGKVDVEVGKPTNAEMALLETNDEWYRKAPWNDWNPATVPAEQKETLVFTVKKDTTSKDGWWDYKRLLDDGKLTIDVHFGWDYHSNYHLKHSREFYGWLKSEGFTSPVSSFDKLDHNTGPLTRTISAGGKDVEIQVRIFYGKPGTDTDPDTDAGGIQLENDMRASLRNQDVIVYSGHSGPFYGFALADWKKTDEGDLDDADVATVEMPRDKYQIVVAEGCDTYMLGQAFKDNPYKQGKNVDVITTTSFSNASTPVVVEEFIQRLIEQDSSDRMRPRTMMMLLQDYAELDDYAFNTMYGIHGADDNPHLHPFANLSKLDATCSRTSECGGPGNSCITVKPGAAKRCAVACSADDGCPSTFKCKKVAANGMIYGSMCVKPR